MKPKLTLIPKLNYKLELKQFWFMYLKLLLQVIIIPIIFVIIPFVVFFDWMLAKFEGNYITRLYLHYVQFTNMEINLP